MRENRIKTLENELEELKSADSSTAPTEHRPSATCMGCEHLVIEEKKILGKLEGNFYSCKLDNHCPDMKQRKFAGGDKNVR